jgi:hypothetical protein
MKQRTNEDKISKIMNDPKKVREAIQSGINDALRKHKLLGNPVCGSKNGKIFWVQPEDIVVSKK